MAILTANQAYELAENLLRITNALGKYRYENIETLTNKESLKIKELHRKQLEEITELYTKAAVLSLDDTESALKKIEAVTKDTTELYSTLSSVQNVLDRATSVLSLTTAIVSFDLKAINNEIENLVTINE